MAKHRDQAEPGSPLDDASAPFYTIGQVAQILGLQPATLRRLDEQEIVSPSRSGGGQRRYSREEMDRLREVVALTGDGITLPGVREVLALRRRVAELEAELDDLRSRQAGGDSTPAS